MSESGLAAGWLAAPPPRWDLIRAIKTSAGEKEEDEEAGEEKRRGLKKKKDEKTTVWGGGLEV